MANHLNVDTATIEGGTGAWTNWVNTTGGVERVTDQFYEGAASLRITKTSTTGVNWGVTFNNWPGFTGVTAGDKTIRFRCRQGTLTTTGTFRVKWRDASNADVLVTDVPVSDLDATWKLFTATATAPAGTEKVYVEFSGPAGTTDQNVLYLDDIYIGDLEGDPPPAPTTVTLAASTNVGVTGTWTNPQNAYSDDNTYATASPGKNASLVHEFAGFGASAIPEGSTINSVTVRQRWFVSTTASVATLGSQAYVGTTAQGTEFTNSAEPTAETLETYAVTGLTRDQLLDLRVRIRASRGNNNTAFTVSLDMVDVVVEYVPPETATPVAATDTAAGSESGALTATRTASDTSAASETSTTTAGLSAGDTGSSAESAVVSVPIVSSDTGTGTDSSSLVISEAKAASDSGTATDSVTVVRLSSATDGATGSETASSGVLLARTDTASATDSASLLSETPKVGTDAASGTDTASVTVTSTAVETGTATESSAVQSGDARSASDSGQATDSAAVTVTATTSDNGTAAESSGLVVVLVPSDTGLAEEGLLLGTALVANEAGTGVDIAQAQDVVLLPAPIAASVQLATPRAVVEVVKDGAAAIASGPSATTSSSAPAVGG